jgi:hypothetical protein
MAENDGSGKKEQIENKCSDTKEFFCELNVFPVKVCNRASHLTLIWLQF